MIARLHGRLLEKELGQVLVDVNGVAYEVDVPLTTACTLVDAGSEVTLHTHLLVREDAQLLFGFSSKEEREVFRTLIRVNGIGPKLALAILSGLDAAALSRTVRAGDLQTLTSVPGVGKRTAERIVMELKDRLPNLDPEGAAEAATSAPRSATEDAEAALIGLGYKPQDAARALAMVEADAPDLEALIRLALKQLMKQP